MKSILIVVSLGVVALSVVCVVQSRKLGEAKRELTSLRSELTTNAHLLETMHRSEELAGQRVESLLQQTEDLSTQLRARVAANAAAETALTNAKVALEEKDAQSAKSGATNADTSGFGAMFSKMMQDPNAKKFIRDQQRMMVDQLYAPLVRQLGLTPQESTQFKELLADNMMRGTEKASTFLGATNRTEGFKSLAEEQKNSEEQLKAFLGESRYAFYQDYQQTVGERAQLNQFRQMGGSDNPLTDTQVEQLLGIIKQERQAVGATTPQGLGTGSPKDPAQLEAMLSNGEFEKMLEKQQIMNERVFQRANEVLAADQMEAFGRFQTNQLQMMRFGMSMARKMFSTRETSE